MIVALTSPAEAYCNSTISACTNKLHQVDAGNASEENYLNALTDRVTMWNFDLKTNHWTKVLIQFMKGKGEVAILQGIIHYFLEIPNSQASLGFYFEPQNKTFVTLPQAGISGDPHIFVTPCYLQL